jgi:hypothetical protein
MIAEVLSRPTLVITNEQHLTFVTRLVKRREKDDRIMRHQIFKVVKIIWKMRWSQKKLGMLNERY